MTTIKTRLNDEEKKKFVELQSSYNLSMQYGGDSQTIKRAIDDALRLKRIEKRLKELFEL